MVMADMLVDPFYGEGGRQATLAELRDYIAETTNSTPVDGLAEIEDAGDAVVGSERISGFTASSRHDEWLLPLSARRGLSWRTGEVPSTTKAKVSFALPVGFGNGSPLPQPSGAWDVFVNDRLAVSIRVVNHAQVWENGPCSFAFSAARIETAEPFQSLCLSSIVRDESFAAFGPALLTVPASWTEPGRPSVIRVEARSEAPSTRWFQVARTHSTLQYSDICRLVALVAGERHPRLGDYSVYFGDIHTHSGQVFDVCENKGCGMGTREDNYRYAMGPGALDFYALSDHEYQIDPQKIDAYLDLADAFNNDGRFVCLPSFEFTSRPYGHRNVYFKGPGGTVVHSQGEWGQARAADPAKSVTPPALWSALAQTGVPFITVPHHSSAACHPLTWEFFSPDYDRLIEVYSSWGSSEYYGDVPRGFSDRYRTLDVRDALKRGLHFGLIASSDGHDGHPGNAQSPLVKHHHIFHFCGSGRAAVLASDLTRDAVFDALYARRCYATTGGPIVLNVTLNGALMGAELPLLPAGSRPELRITCAGTNGIDHLRIVKNARVVCTVPCHGEWDAELEWEDAAFDPTVANSYYVRVVQKDNESAWSSPIWVG